MDLEKYASEALDLLINPKHYRDRGWKQNFIPTMSKEDAESEMEYLHTPESKRFYDNYEKVRDGFNSVLMTGGGYAMGRGLKGTNKAGLVGSALGLGSAIGVRALRKHYAPSSYGSRVNAVQSILNDE